MNNKIINLFLYISSFIPLYFFIIVKELIEIINGNLTFDITNVIMIIFNFLLIIFGIFGFVFNYKKTKYNKVEVIKFQNITCENFLPYCSLFVLFALSFELEFVSMATVYFLIIILLGIVYVKNEMFYINPFLNMLGFSTYKITYKKNDKVFEEAKIFSKSLPQKFCKTNGLFIKK